MNITSTSISKLNTKLMVTITKEDYEANVSAALKKHAKQASLKGFRPGQVPIGVMKKMYGNSILAEELNKIIDNSVKNYIDENKLAILGQPIPTDSTPQSAIDITLDKNYDFEFEIGLSPEFEIQYANHQFEKQVVEASEESIQKEVDRLRKRFGNLKDVDAVVSDEDLMYFNISELNESNAIKEGGFTKSTIVSLKDVLPGKGEELKKMKSGSQAQLNIAEILDNNKINIAKYVLGVSEDELAAMNPVFNFELTKVSTMEPAEINADFFAKAAGGDDSIVDEASFKAKIKSSIEDYYKNESEHKLSQDIFEKLVLDTPIELPDAFLKRYIKKTNEKPITDEILDKEFGHYAKELKWDLISGKLAKENDIKVDFQEVKDALRMNILQQMYQYGYMNFTEEQIDNYVNNMLKDRNQVNQTYQGLLDTKVLNAVKGKVTIKEMNFTEEAFNDDTKKRREKREATQDNNISYYNSDVEEMETEEAAENGEQSNSFMGNMKNMAGKLFGK